MLEPLGTEPSLGVFSAAMRGEVGQRCRYVGLLGFLLAAGGVLHRVVPRRGERQQSLGGRGQQRDPRTVRDDVLHEAGLLAGVDGAAAEREVPRQRSAGGPAAPSSAVPRRAATTDSPCATLRWGRSGRWVRPLNHTSPIDEASGLAR